MPIGGADGIGFDESSPSDSESAGLGDDRIRSLKTSLRQGLDSEHNWPSSGGNAVGYHRLGSARAFFGPQSAVSSSGTDGRLMLTSDTSRLFGVGSGGSLLLGSPFQLSVGTTAGISFPQRHYWAVEFGTMITGSDGTASVTIPNSGYSGVPYVVSTSSNERTVYIDAVTPTSFTVHTGNLIAYATWISIGTRVIA